MNESAGHVFRLVELHVQLESSCFLEFTGTIENPPLVSAILNERVVGCGGGNGDTWHVRRKDSWTAVESATSSSCWLA